MWAISPLVVGEALKSFWHRARRAGLHLYRDGEGNEVGLLLELGNGAYPIEIEAGETGRTRSSSRGKEPLAGCTIRRRPMVAC